ncbi:dihydrofolate reductase family protein [Chitinophaga filiformis]|uniref:Dihydrofolate reductase family protein n=1 Tax=Chitinophaga filiformis TaxID=104663 RepID=A0ABY4HVI7_CHIFI|nr:dihydrofolate reductase family protein [Chitinophaga filiformis]UPK66566.1 dihydrofolate reductase family protein [Chitinophaga filiformis]
MRKVILNLAVTLDGFIEGPNGEIDWCITDDGPGSEEGITSHFNEFLARIDTIFYGRLSYDLWGQYQPAADASLAEKKLWESVHSKNKYVFSTQQNESDDAVYITSDIADRVNELKDRPGKDIWLYGGAKLITTFVNLGLVDNYLLAMHPVILGGGKPLFSDLKSRTDLKLRRTVTSTSGVILLDYEKL